MKALPTHQRHSHMYDDLDTELPMLALGAVVLFVTTLAVYLYAATL